MAKLKCEHLLRDTAYAFNSNKYEKTSHDNSTNFPIIRKNNYTRLWFIDLRIYDRSLYFKIYHNMKTQQNNSRVYLLKPIKGRFWCNKKKYIFKKLTKFFPLFILRMYFALKKNEYSINNSLVLKPIFLYINIGVHHSIWY